MRLAATTVERAEAGSPSTSGSSSPTSGTAAALGEAGGCAVPGLCNLGPPGLAPDDAASTTGVAHLGRRRLRPRRPPGDGGRAGCPRTSRRPPPQSPTSSAPTTADPRRSSQVATSSTAARSSSRLPPGPLPSSGTYELMVVFEPMEPIEPLRPSRAIQPIVVTVPIEVVDDPARADSADAAIAAFAADPRLPEYVEAQALPDRPDLTQTYTVELSWWRDAWSSGRSLLRGEPSPADALRPGQGRGRRRPYGLSGAGTEDEPGAASRPPGFDEPDEVIPATEG